MCSEANDPTANYDIFASEKFSFKSKQKNEIKKEKKNHFDKYHKNFLFSYIRSKKKIKKRKEIKKGRNFWTFWNWEKFIIINN